jgi:hypothetical protein
MDKTYTYAGWSFYKDEWKLRFANDGGRARHLQKVGHEHVMLCPLPEAMTEEQASMWLFAQDFCENAPWKHFASYGETSPLLADTAHKMWYIEYYNSQRKAA